VQEPAESRYYSFILEVKGTGRGATFEGNVRLSDGREVGLASGCYQVRVWLDEQDRLLRGTLRRVDDDQILSFQTGDRVTEFIRACLKEGGPGSWPGTRG
jgi:hypothetical protein